MSRGENSGEYTAIIGYASRFPGADTPDELWELLIEKRDATNEVPENRQNKNRIKSHIKRGGFLKCPVDEIDAEFFGLSTSEAELLDPRQRLLLELTWESLEDAGIDPLVLKGSKTDVFVGQWSPDYGKILEDHRDTCNMFTQKSIYLSSGHGVSAARVSHFLGLHGYHECSDAGCSSSLTSLYEGYSRLLRHECNLCIVAGLNLILTNTQTKLDSLVLAPNGRCKTFGAEADGYARAEGIGVLVLKRLSDAVRDRDRIHAIIRGIGVNYNSSDSSFGNPDRQGQIKAIEEALRASNLSPEQISYVEAHGTGVLVGDTVELEALSSVYSRNREKSNPLFVSSLKANIGHCEAASGIAAIIKVILALKNEMIPPQVPYNKINPDIQKQLKILHGEIPLETVPWKRNAKKRFAGISGFALGGENAHVILEEPPATIIASEPEEFLKEWHVLALSAKSQKGLSSKVQSYIQFLQKNPNCNLADLVFSSNCGRAHFNYRATVVGRNIKEMEESLRVGNYNKSSPKEVPSKVCFLFSKELQPDLSITKYLYDVYPVFKNSFDICSKHAENILRDPLHVFLEGQDFLNSVHKEEAKIIMTFAANYSLLKLWESFGVIPNCSIVNEIGLENRVGNILGFAITSNLSISDAIKMLSENGGNCSHFKLFKKNHDSKLASLLNSSEKNTHKAVHSATNKENMKTIFTHMENDNYVIYGIGCSSIKKNNDRNLNSDTNHTEYRLKSWNWSFNCHQDLWKLFALNLSHLYVTGTHICWNSFESPFKIYRQKIDLPKYSFQREKYWVGDSMYFGKLYRKMIFA